MTPEQRRAHLTELFDTGHIQIQRGPIFDAPPPPLPDALSFDRIDGMMLGLAVGDALGRPTEGRKPVARRAKHGEVRDYVIGRRAKQAVGIPSDDTQLAFWTLEQINRSGAFDPPALAKLFASREIFGMGQTVSKFRRNVKAGKPWTHCGPSSAGNGALMRIAPMVIPHLRAPSTDLWVDTALSAMLTHNDSGSIAACVAFVSMLWRALGMTEPPAPNFWLAHYVDIAKTLENGTTYEPRGGQFTDYAGELWAFVDESVRWAEAEGVATVDACDAWYSGAYLLETMPCVILLLTRYAHDPELALIRAVNDTKDNDTIAAIVGAAVGALHGRDALPTRWIDGHTGRTGRDDDGRIFDILADARERWAG